MQSNGQNMRPALDLRPPDKILNQIKNVLCWPTKNMANHAKKASLLCNIMQYYSRFIFEYFHIILKIFVFILWLLVMEDGSKI